MFYVVHRYILKNLLPSYISFKFIMIIYFKVYIVFSDFAIIFELLFPSYTLTLIPKKLPNHHLRRSPVIPLFQIPLHNRPKHSLNHIPSISQYACISTDKAIATYSIGLLSNNLCSFASDCSVVLRAAFTSSHFIRNIFPSVNHTST